MKKMKFETEELSQKNIEKIGKLFPNCITEAKDENGKLKKAIDFEMLKQMLSDDVVKAGDETYEFTWVGKKEAMVEANKPIRKTLRPCKEESKDWDNTENLYIEGDNLEVLKLLQESYLNSIKMIYIDPPYNTGNDFIYNDDFKMTNEEYKDESGEVDEEGNRLFKNTDTNGRFHSDWCSMMYSRLMLARNLLSDDGVIFISIDDNEEENLKKICDEIFGKENFVGTIVVKSNPRGSMSTSLLAELHEYILIYSKYKHLADIIGHELSDEMISEYNKSDKNGRYRELGLRMRGGFWRKVDRPNLYFPIYVNPKNLKVSLLYSEDFSEKILPIQPSTNEEGTWRWSKEKILNNAELLIGKKVKRSGKEVWDIYQKDYLIPQDRRTKAKSIWDKKEVNYQNATEELKQIFKENKIFEYSKPVFLLKEVVSMIGFKKGDITLDFFSGSSTTAHAVMELNAEDNGKRKFIMVQIPEECDKKSSAYKAGYKNICEIGKERIRCAGDKIKEDNKDKEGIENIDIGFRVLKLDDTNMKDVYYAPDKYNQEKLFDFESNIKEDRTELDLLFGCLIEWGLPLNRAYESKNIEGSTVHIYNDGDLIACFDNNISEEAIKKIAKMEPLRVVFRDSSFETSANKINVEEIFKLLSPETSVRVI
ncbi:TPA: site-specific DNA-methyltransferase [Clostridium perfringens]|uniref:site-specific DNA-methyltransferase n=1 Tax=Clostridium perfringens TaxID=1502 RepID=UPI001CAB0740|nr:site-specific DNA-methyltransferase [Clostridium perfringens]MCX0359005.1 site-specific DNA-methyltransferase [Clostridium perfringens]MCX0418086.1 site-specific DNA-methyltransferase [Clostridium perfringens]MDU6691640.1 site-specific DNA-methyltransferase [Clostridium perfringens]UBK32197.1 site-specific DNA-methyltransferase [Clostridium perfringens]UBK47347.1 site-specific DNA-methyltransferase [Clostridium perfringens]